MRHAAKMNLLAGAVVGLGGAPFAVADGPAQSEGASADEIRAMVAEMLSDAETRTSLLQSGGTAGHDGNFFISSPDNNFRLEVSGQIQFRYVINTLDDEEFEDPDNPGEFFNNDDFTPGFQARRTKLTFEGHVFDPDLFYKVQGAFDRDGGDFELEDAYVGYRFGNGMSVTWGQFKAPLLREELVSSKRQLAAERSLSNAIFTADRTQGIAFGYEAERWRVMASFTDGLRGVNNDFNMENADWALTGRGEFLVMGDWSQFQDFTSRRGSENGLLLGGAIHYEQGPDLNNGGEEPEILVYTFDASYEGNGFNLYGAFIGQYLDDDDVVSPLNIAGSADSQTNFSYLIQGGVFVTEDLEVFGRWDHIFFDEEIMAGQIAEDEFKTITAGVNYYLYGHGAKFTADVVWSLDAVPGNFTGLGLLGSSEEDQFAIRLQFQLLF